MILFTEKRDCSGCWACYNNCQKGALKMQQDEEGFYYPQIDSTICVECKQCASACPVAHPALTESRIPSAVFASYHQNEEIRLQSSSGGVFTALAENVLRQSGVVYGVGFNDKWQVTHQRIADKTQLPILRKSKYAESMVLDTLRQARKDLREGKEVLFSGTPCQVAGLKRYLKKPYSNLTTVDFICHGIPSSKVFDDYLQSNCVDGLKKNLLHVDCRGKQNGWKKFSMHIESRRKKRNYLLVEPMYRNRYLKGFLKDLFLRPSCHQCQFKGFKSGADITIGDFWQVEKYHPNLNDDKGVSILTINTTKGKEQVTAASRDLVLIASEYAYLHEGNGYIETPVPEPQERALFFKKYLATRDKQSVLKKATDYSLPQKILLIYRSGIHRIKNKL